MPSSLGNITSLRLAEASINPLNLRSEEAAAREEINATTMAASLPHFQETRSRKGYALQDESTMTSSASKKYEDFDDFGYPKNRPPTPRMRKITRYRNPALLVTFIVGLIYWWSGLERADPIDWSLYAYSTYVTDDASMCNAFMVFETLHRLGSKADRVLMYPEEWDAQDDDPGDRSEQLLVRAKRQFKVKLKPVQLLGVDGPVSPPTRKKSTSGWDASITKIRAFELEEYERVLHLDTDITLLQHMDELFSLPSTPMAMPRAYWSDVPPGEWPLSSLLMLLQPNAAETKHMYDLLQQWRLNPDRGESTKYDMELLNERFGASALVLPHRPYALLSAEFRNHDHSAYMGTFNAPESTPKWDPFRAVKEAKLVHFSDWPLPKPWIMWPKDGLMEIQPDCGGTYGTCAEREVWKSLYDEFRQRRKQHCKLLSVPAPINWQQWKNETGAGPS